MVLAQLVFELDWCDHAGVPGKVELEPVLPHRITRVRIDRCSLNLDYVCYVIFDVTGPSAGRSIRPSAVVKEGDRMPAEFIVGEVAEVRQYGKIVAHRIETGFEGDLFFVEEFLHGDLVEPHILPLAKDRLVRDIATGPVRKVDAGAFRHRVARDGVRPNAQFVEVKAEAEDDLISIGGTGTVDAGRI